MKPAKFVIVFDKFNPAARFTVYERAVSRSEGILQRPVRSFYSFEESLSFMQELSCDKGVIVSESVSEVDDVFV